MKKEFCPHCGQGIMRQKQSLSRTLVMILRKTAEAYKPEVHLQKDLTLTKNEYANFQKLKYWGLVRKAEKSGFWLITKIGYDFLAGKIVLPKAQWTFNNTVVGQEGGLISIQDLKLEPWGYKQREEYSQDATVMPGLESQFRF